MDRRLVATAMRDLARRVEDGETPDWINQQVANEIGAINLLVVKMAERRAGIAPCAEPGCEVVSDGATATLPHSVAAHAEPQRLRVVAGGRIQ